ncbi:MAG: hypothetical protein OEM02_00560 [Desulfobulbaceae bacterium]|nr:hypothetical protein [Desulfobulbaceae bacterium]
MALPTYPLTIWTFIISATLLCTLTFFCAYWYLQNKKKENTILELQRELQIVQHKITILNREGKKKEKFIQSLSEAEVTNRFQALRSPRNAGFIPGPPERYRYLSAMIKAGIPVQDIADILDIPPMEIDQLITLAKIAGNNK